MLKERYLTAPITEDLEKKMVFIGGPRQVGKSEEETATARSLGMRPPEATASTLLAIPKKRAACLF